MVSLELKLSNLPGSTIEEVSVQMHSIAATLGVVVTCAFNNAELHAYPNGSASTLSRAYREIQDNTSGINYYSTAEGVTATNPVTKMSAKYRNVIGG